MGNTILVSLLLALTEFIVIVLVSPLARPSLVLRFLPEDIREAAKGHPEPPKWKQCIAHLLAAVFALAWLGGSIWLGADGLRQGCGFWQLWLRYTVMLELIKLFDIVVQDRWLVMTSGFYKRLFPETADCAGWEDRRWNMKGQLIRLLVFPLLSLIPAGLCMLIGPMLPV